MTEENSLKVSVVTAAEADGSIADQGISRLNRDPSAATNMLRSLRDEERTQYGRSDREG